MIDAHCHLYESDEIGAEVQRFREAGGVAMICCGAGVESSQKAIEIADKYPEVWATVGVPPEKNPKSQIPNPNELLKLTNHKKVVAVGECGLDYQIETGERERESQRELFLFNIDLAKETGLPLVVHYRNAFQEIFQSLDANRQLPVMMHCFTGNLEQMQECVKRGWCVSFGGIVTFKGSHALREVARVVPEDRLLIETDAPYLAPEPVRGMRNEPKNVKMVAETIAKLRRTSIDQIERLVYQNMLNLFKKIHEQE